MNKIVITVPEDSDGMRIDKFLAEAIDYLTRSALQKLITAGNVEIDGKPVAKSRVLKEGEDISVFIPDAVSLDVEAEDIPLDMLDDDTAVHYAALFSVRSTLAALSLLTEVKKNTSFNTNLALSAFYLAENLWRIT